MAKFFNEAGEEVEAFSKEEFDALNATVADLTTKLADGTMPDGQKARLLKDRDDAIAAAKALDDKFSKEIGDLKTTMVDGYKDKAFGALAGTDADLLKKLDFEYNQFTGDALTEAEIADRARKAYILATGEAPKPSIMDNISGMGGHGGTQPNPVAKVETEVSKEMRKTFGITDEQVEKYKDKLTLGK